MRPYTPQQSRQGLPLRFKVRRLLLRNLLALALLALHAAARALPSRALPSQALPSQTLPSQTLPPLESAQVLGQELYLGSGSTGLVLVVVRGNQTAINTFGAIYPDSRQAPAADSLIRLCSLTKIFTTDLLVKLVQAKLVRLDTPLQALAPGQVHVPLRDRRPITLEDLATHTSGLPREIGPSPGATPHFTYPSPQTRWRWLTTQHLRTVPGTAALYSNVGFDLLSDALAQAARTPYPRLLAARITKPLGMTETTFTPAPAQCGRLLVSAHPEGPCTETTNTDGSSGLYSTASDMARFLAYLVGTGGSTHSALPRQNPAAQSVYLKPGSLMSVQGLDHAGEATGIGLGWIHTPGSDNTAIVEKTGGGAGFETYIAILPGRHIALFVAATDGPVYKHFNLYSNANNVLLKLAGLPELTLPPPRPHPAPRHRRRRRRRG